METDPFSTPAANSHSGSNAGCGPVSVGVVEQLAATKPWVRFMSVMIFIGAGFMVLIALVMAVAGIAGGFTTKSSANPFAGPMGLGFMAFYGVLAFLYIFPAVKLWKYATFIGKLVQTGRDENLVAALNQRRSFWKYIGILVLVMMALYFVAILAVGVFAGMAAASAK